MVKKNDILQSCYYTKDHAKISTNVYGIYIKWIDTIYVNDNLDNFFCFLFCFRLLQTNK